MARRAALLIPLLLACAPGLADDSMPSEVPAAWTRFEVDFQYMGFTTRYTCSGLRSKVRLLLKHMGVRDDVKIVERNCEVGYERVAEMPRLKVVFWAPTTLRQGDKNIGDPVLGVWKPVVIKRNEPRGLEMGDCELVEIFRDRIISRLATREMQDDVNCIPRQLVGNRINLSFEVLTGIQPVDTAANALRP
jgi:hypothetical protein